MTNHNEIEKTIEDNIQKLLRTKLEKVKYPHKPYPELMILDRTRNIFGYLEIRELKEKKKINGDLNNHFTKLLNEVRITYSELDRPVFYVYWKINQKQQIELKFQTSEQLQDIILNKLERGDPIPYIPIPDDMGEFQEMMTLINSNL